MVLNPVALRAHTGQGEAWKNHHGPAAGDLQRWNVTLEPAGGSSVDLELCDLAKAKGTRCV